MPSSPASALDPVVLTDPFGLGVAFASVGFDPTRTDLPSDGLHDEERALALAMSASRRASFAAGRSAMRAVVRTLAPDAAQQPLLSTARGAPRLPAGLTGSISHKRQRAIAVAAHDNGYLLGVDLEERPREVDASRPSIARRVLTEEEREVIAPLDPLAHREATLIRFALKEAVYKAIDPTVQRYVQFTEVLLDDVADGTARVTLMLPELRHHDIAITTRWSLDDDYIVAVASCRATPPPR